jgi:hypothetical protein
MNIRQNVKTFLGVSVEARGTVLRDFSSPLSHQTASPLPVDIPVRSFVDYLCRYLQLLSNSWGINYQRVAIPWCIHHRLVDQNLFAKILMVPNTPGSQDSIVMNTLWNHDSLLHKLGLSNFYCKLCLMLVPNRPEVETPRCIHSTVVKTLRWTQCRGVVLNTRKSF